MGKKITWLPMLWGMLWITPLGCSDSGNIDDNDGNGGSDGDSDGDGDGDSDSDGDITLDGPVCADFTGGADPIPSRVMLLEDASGSMDDDNKWNLAVNAIDDMVTRYGAVIEFGLDVFPIDGNDRSNRDQSGATCNVGNDVLIDTEFDNADPIMNQLGRLGPTGATPLLLALSNFADPNYAPRFAAGDSDAFLVIISDGEDTCGEDGEFDRNGNSGASPTQLALMTQSLYEDAGIRTYAIGFGSGAVQGDGAEQLTAIAMSGGTGENSYLDATNVDDLERVLDNLAQSVAISCQYRLGAITDPNANLDNVNVYLDSRTVPRDPDCEDGDGWTWSDNNTKDRIIFCNDPCDRLQANEIDEVRVVVMCNSSDVVI